MWPAPLTSGGLALEEVTCRGWGPHPLIKLASLSGKYEKAHSDHHSPFLHIELHVLCILDFSDQRLWDCLCLVRIRVRIKE